jgi:hypothetical protein
MKSYEPGKVCPIFKKEENTAKGFRTLMKITPSVSAHQKTLL